MCKGKPLVCDFGITEIPDEINNNTTADTVSSGDIVRYGAPELIDTDRASATEHWGIHSFAMLIPEHITERYRPPTCAAMARSYTRELPRGSAPIWTRVSDGYGNWRRLVGQPNHNGTGPYAYTTKVNDTILV